VIICSLVVLPHLPIVVGDYFTVMSVDLSIVVIYCFFICTINTINFALYLLFSFTLSLSYFSLQLIGVEICHGVDSLLEGLLIWLKMIR